MSPVNLFKNGLASDYGATLGLRFAANLMGYFFLINWLPTVLQDAKLSASDATIATMLLQFGGVIGGWTLCRPMDKTGVLSIIGLFLVATVMVATIGSIGGYGVLAVQATVFFTGVSVLGSGSMASMQCRPLSILRRSDLWDPAGRSPPVVSGRSSGRLSAVC